MSTLNIAVQGCCHGELDVIYNEIIQTEAKTGHKIDLLLICGDLQCVRTVNDLQSVAVPPKYRHMNNFYQYVNGEKIAPVMTIFVGGNHEASNILQSLYYGGFVAPNIYFLGFSGVVWYKGIKIGGLSGIFNQRHYHAGHYETPPYSEDTMRSIYHLRELEVLRMQHYSSLVAQAASSDSMNGAVDIFLSHDWPNGIWDYGDVSQLLRLKPYFREDMQSGKLGSQPLRFLLEQLQPDFWFAAHLHVKFPAIYPHYIMLPASSFPESLSEVTEQIEPSTEDTVVAESDQQAQPVESNINENSNADVLIPVVKKLTRFLALDKIIPNRGYLQFLQIPMEEEESDGSSITALMRGLNDNELHFDPDWCAIIQKSHSFVQTGFRTHGKSSEDIKTHFLPTDEERDMIRRQLQAGYGEQYIIPNIMSMPIYCLEQQTTFFGDVQTDAFLSTLQLEHNWTRPFTTIPVYTQYTNFEDVDVSISSSVFVPPLPPGPPPAQYSLASLQSAMVEPNTEATVNVSMATGDSDYSFIKQALGISSAADWGFPSILQSAVAASATIAQSTNEPVE